MSVITDNRSIEQLLEREDYLESRIAVLEAALARARALLAQIEGEK